MLSRFLILSLLIFPNSATYFFKFLFTILIINLSHLNSITCWYYALPCGRVIPTLVFTFFYVWKLCSHWAWNNTDLTGDRRDRIVGSICMPLLWKHNQLLVVHWSTHLQSLDSLGPFFMSVAFNNSVLKLITSVRINWLFYLSFTVVPSNTSVFISCRLTGMKHRSVGWDDSEK